MSSLVITSKVDRIVSSAGKDNLYFGGTAYLGMGSLPEFEQLVLDGIRRYGPNYGASRSGNVQLDVYKEMEDLFASQAGSENAVLMSSGFMAGHVTAVTLNKLSDESWIAPGTHPAILPKDGGNETFGSRTFEEFKRKCVEASGQMEGKTIAVFANAVDPLGPGIHDFDWVKELSDGNTYYLLIDDSHAFGLVGKEIFGTYAQWKKLPVNLVVCGSLGKALGIPAGIVLGSSHFIRRITDSPIFISSSPPSPGMCWAFLEAQSLYIKQQVRLQENLEYLYALIEGFPQIRFRDDFPVATFLQAGWSERLRQKQILISSFPYPSPDDNPLDRVVVSAYHTENDLIRLVDGIK